MSQLRRVVVVFASAGGLKALGDFLAGLFVDDTTAVFAAMHQPPDACNSLLDQLPGLSSNRVEWVVHGSRVEGGRIQLVPAGVPIALQAGGFHVGHGVAHGGRPVDGLLTQAAALFGDRLVAVVLSGAGIDGVEGCQAVADAGGTVFAQSPAEAEPPVIPLAVIADGLASFVGHAEALAERVNSIGPDRGAAVPGGAAVEVALELLALRSGPDFRLYKQGLISRRMSHRVSKLGHPSVEAYLATLQDDPAELEELRQDLLISVTSTFRNPATWDVLAQEIVGPMCRQAARGTGSSAPSGSPRMLRAWVAACATGEEAYSVAMLLAETSVVAGGPAEFQVIGTDVDARAIAVARSGRLSAAAVEGIPQNLRERWIEQGPDGPQVVEALRKQVVFGVHDVLGDAPFGRIDLLLCRNLFIYLNDAGQRRAVAAFARALAPGGCLVLGRDEMLPEGLTEWQATSELHRIYRHVPDKKALGGLPQRVGDLTRLPTSRGCGAFDSQCAAAGSASLVSRGLVATELRSAYESLQCLNEELRTVNDELRLANDQLDQALRRERQASTKLQAIVASAIHPMLVLDDRGRLEHFSRSAGQLFRLRSGDEGRPLDDFANDLVWPEFGAIVRRCAGEGGDSITQEAQDIRGGHWLVTAAPLEGPRSDERKVLITAINTSGLRDATRLQVVLDALPQQVAVLDAHGRIEYVNSAWRAFGKVNGADPARIDVGVDYLEACASAAAPSDPYGKRAAQGVTDLLAGRSHEFRMRYPCATPHRTLWFLLHVNALGRPEGGVPGISHGRDGLAGRFSR